MIKSIIVAYLNFHIARMMSCIKGKGNGFRFIFLFNLPNSEINRIVLFFLGISKEGHAHSEDFIRDSTPCSTNLATFFFIVSINQCGIRNGLAQKFFIRPLVRKIRVNRSTYLFPLGRLGCLHGV